MKVIVFGGSGFLGSHVADALGEAGYKVAIFDQSPSPYLRPGQEMITGDILDAGAVEKAIRGCRVVYNLAGLADIDECAKRPVETVRTNILGNTLLLEAARKAGAERFIFASSVYVYSDYGSFYRCSKQACESYIENYSASFGLPYTILRYGSLYGERADGRNGIYRIIESALTKGLIEHRGDGEELREFIHVRDAAALSVEVLQEQYKNRHVILTGSQPMRFKDLFEMIREMVGRNIEITYREAGGGEHYKVTPYAFNPRLGYKLVKNPFIDLGQGLLSCIAEVYETVSRGKTEEMGLYIDKEGK